MKTEITETVTKNGEIETEVIINDTNTATRKTNFITTLRLNGTNKVGWKYTCINIGKAELADFEMLTNRRDIRQGVVNKLCKLLMQGTHFETPLMCNKVQGKYRLVDGNHRYEAIKKFLNVYTQRKVEIGILYYDNLNIDEEKKMFTTWNLGTKQSTNDFIKQYWDDIPITKYLNVKAGFPCKVAYTWLLGMEFKQMLYAYLGWKNKTKSLSIRGSTMEFIESCQRLDKPDVTIMKAMMTELIQIYGDPTRSNPAYRQVPFLAIARIWLDNHRRFAPEKLQKLLGQLKGSPILSVYEKESANQKSLVSGYTEFLRYMNGDKANQNLRLIATL